jgi:hypothetical protein
MDKDVVEEYERIQSIRQIVLYEGVNGQPANITAIKIWAVG